MVETWVFAGGGASEVKGFFPFLREHFNQAQFERKTPYYQKPGARPDASGPRKLLGGTGGELANRITRQLRAALNRGENCDLILVMDDLDCHAATERKELFMGTANNVLGEFPHVEPARTLVGFAAPEIEAWLIADWNNTFAGDVDFRDQHRAMRHRLVSQHNVPFAEPEDFSTFDEEKDACEEKLSALIMEAALDEANVHYSKAVHTSRLLQKITVSTVISKCPLFGQWYRELEKFIPREK